MIRNVEKFKTPTTRTERLGKGVLLQDNDERRGKGMKLYQKKVSEREKEKKGCCSTGPSTEYIVKSIATDPVHAARSSEPSLICKRRKQHPSDWAPNGRRVPNRMSHCVVRYDEIIGKGLHLNL